MPERRKRFDERKEARPREPPAETLERLEEDRGGTVHGGGLGGNRLTEVGGAEGVVTDEDLTPGERRRGGERVEARERRPRE